MSKRYLQFRTMLAVGAMIALAACGGNTPSNSSVDTGTAQATTVAESGAAETNTPAGEGGTGAEPEATAAPTDASTVTGAATSDAAAGTTTPDANATTTGTDTGTATPDAGASTGDVTASTPLTGPNVSYGGVTFDVDASTIPSISVQNGAVNMMGAGATSGSTASSGTLSGTIFTFEGMNAGSAGSPSGLFQPRILVIPVSQLVSYEAAMMAGGTSASAGATDTMTSTAEATSSSDSSTGTATPEATPATGSSSDMTGTMTSTMQGMDESTFISELSRTLTSQSSFASTAMSDSMVLTRALSLLGFEGYTPAFQSNGEFLEFQNGRGVRFVTAFQQSDSSPAALNQLYYMFHGLTNDNRTYVMAIMSLQSNLIGMGSTGTTGTTGSSDTMTSTTEMTGTDAMTGTTGSAGAIEFPTDGDASAYQDYLDQVVAGLDQAASGTSDAAFSTALEQFDALIQSLNISESAQ